MAVRVADTDAVSESVGVSVAVRVGVRVEVGDGVRRDPPVAQEADWCVSRRLEEGTATTTAVPGCSKKASISQVANGSTEGPWDRPLVAVKEALEVAVGLRVPVVEAVGDRVRVGEREAVSVALRVTEGVRVEVAEAEQVTVSEGVRVPLAVVVTVAVPVVVTDCVAVGVRVGVADAVGVGVRVPAGGCLNCCDENGI